MPDNNHSEEAHMISSAVEVHKAFHISRREGFVALVLLVFLITKKKPIKSGT